VAQPAKIIDPDFEFLQDQYSGIHSNDSENPGLLIIILSLTNCVGGKIIDNSLHFLIIKISG
jgi:hypothetical protein